MIVVKAPGNFEQYLGRKYTVFLAGSIEGDTAEQWQTKVANELTNTDMVLVNPRRDDWDSSWKTTKNSPQFREQVLWEQEALNACDAIALYFDKDTKSPISLMELGLFAATGKIVMYCPDGFWKKGNVDIVAELYGIPQAADWGEFVTLIRQSGELY